MIERERREESRKKREVAVGGKGNDPRIGFP
jgi:hypothetical protein